MSEAKPRHKRGDRVRRVQAARTVGETPYVELTFTLEYGAYGPRSKAEPGEEWRASYFDRANNRFVAGSGSTPWEAIGWAIVQAVAERMGRLIVAVNGDDTPNTYLARMQRAVGVTS